MRPAKITLSYDDGEISHEITFEAGNETGVRIAAMTIRRMMEMTIKHPDSDMFLEAWRVLARTAREEVEKRS